MLWACIVQERSASPSVRWCAQRCQAARERRYLLCRVDRRDAFDMCGRGQVRGAAADELRHSVVLRCHTDRRRAHRHGGRPALVHGCIRTAAGHPARQRTRAWHWRCRTRPRRRETVPGVGWQWLVLGELSRRITAVGTARSPALAGLWRRASRSRVIAPEELTRSSNYEA
jgi:hypothetical protein